MAAKKAEGIGDSFIVIVIAVLLLWAYTKAKPPPDGVPAEKEISSVRYE